LGVGEPLGDVEVIAAAADVLQALGVLDKTTLELNTLGDTESRQAYRAVLVDYLKGHLQRLSEDSRARLERNPLRILDSKDQSDRAIIAEAPVFTDYLTPGARDYFDRVRAGLDALGIGYSVNARLVRGLDYYCHTAFEFTTTELGAQGTVIAGGRYDGLIEMMGGPPTPGIGWAGGIERLAMLAGIEPPARRPIAVVPIGETAETAALAIAARLRRAGYTVDLGYKGNLKRRMKQANKVNAAAALLLGDDELKRKVATLRDMTSGTQVDVPLDGLETALAGYR
jgi:histidyl-tRNA synthetase